MKDYKNRILNQLKKNYKVEIVIVFLHKFTQECQDNTVEYNI